MADFPLPLTELLGHWGSYGVYLVIGVLFGMTLESAGFGNSKLLAAQFYFKDMRVFKVMFTAIIVAMTLIFLASSTGLMDFNLVWVPPTYLWPGIVGGLIMGVGFIVGGFCPGTSLVAMASGKIDGIFFVGGVLFGIFIFGETVSGIAVFFESSYMGRFTLPELFDVSYGAVVVTVVVMALILFVGAEKVEALVNGDHVSENSRWTIPAAAALVAIAALVLVMGQPVNEDRWEVIASDATVRLENREVQISPAELLNLMHDTKLKAVLLDVREERYYNQFHIEGAIHLPISQVLDAARDLHFEKANAVFVAISNDEGLATEAWRKLKAESVPNVYILEGGVNGWLDTYAGKIFRDQNRISTPDEEQLGFRFNAATGSRHPAADPNPYVLNLEYEPKIILEVKRSPESGGCG
jgi:rhodanese-related sulfurtransferase